MIDQPSKGVTPSLDYAARLCLSLLAFAFVVIRASIQSITIDEADCYLNFIQPASPSHWDAASQNHVLNSLLVRLATTVFGLHHICLRAGAVAGAALYICAAFMLTETMARRTILRIVLLFCLLFNPFIMDYLVAARGYSLALGLLMLAVAAAARYYLSATRPAGSARLLAVCSVFLTLSFCANFAFGIVNGIALVVLTAVILRLGSDSGLDLRGQVGQYGRLILACIAPAAAVLALICLDTLLNWPDGQLWWGATTLRETLRTVTDSSFYQLNSNLANPLVYAALATARPLLLPLLGLLLVLHGVFLFRARRVLNPRDRAIVLVGATLIGVVVAAIAAHWLAFRWAHLLLPRERTAIWMVPLVTVGVGWLAACEAPGWLERYCRRALAGTLAIVACYFLLCSRLMYFKEWSWDADVDRAYHVVAYYNHKYGVRTVVSSWMYSPSLNYYRIRSGHETLEEFSPATEYSKDSLVYVMHGVLDSGFIDRERLKVVYRSDLSNIVVAIRAEVLEGIQQTR